MIRAVQALARAACLPVAVAGIAMLALAYGPTASSSLVDQDLIARPQAPGARADLPGLGSVEDPFDVGCPDR